MGLVAGPAVRGAVLAIGLAATLLSALVPVAEAQTTPRIIDRNRLDELTPPAPVGGAVPGAAPPAASVPPPDIAQRSFVLTAVQVEGATVVLPDRLAATWRAQLGQQIRVAQAYAIADRISALYAAAGLALYRVDVPAQSFADGVLRLRVIEGYVASVRIHGAPADADLTLLKAYAARIVASRPLRRRDLERYILLMNDLPGHRVGSRFEPDPGQSGGVILDLYLAEKHVEGGVTVDNTGQTALGQTQLTFTGGLDNLLHEGDRTQFLFGFPLRFPRYQYYGVTHADPVGADGATISVSLGDLVTHPVGGTLAGNAVLLDVLGSYPVIRAQNESLVISASFDLLDSNDATLGQTLSDERTRAARLAVTYATRDQVLASLDGIDRVSATVSEGLDIFGARRGGADFGGPDFTKLNLRLEREQALPWRFVVRAKATAQLAGEHLPASEQFAYGGLDFGQAFPLAALDGDSAVAAAVELAWRIPDQHVVKWISGAEAFVVSDWATLWTRPPTQPDTLHGASVGVGLRSRVADKVMLQGELAKRLVQPSFLPQDTGWQFVFAVVGAF